MFKQRVFTAIILLAIILSVLIYLPLYALLATILLVFGIAAWEWANLAAVKTSVFQFLYAVCVVLLVLLIAFMTKLGSDDVSLLYIRDILGFGCIWWAVALLWVMYYPNSKVYWRYTFIKSIIGFLVLVPSTIALFYLCSLINGKWIFLYVVGIVVMADVGAYFVGRSFGNSKLAPRVSPGKSWAGFWGGFITVIVYAAIVGSQFSIAGLSFLSLVVISSIAALASVLGDLLESMFKRERGIKDSSQLLPGHGGFMDRVDSITAAAPVFTLLLLLLQVAK